MLYTLSFAGGSGIIGTMKLYFEGHHYQYATEQMLMTLFPGERPEYPAEKTEGERMEVTLRRGEHQTTAVCLYHDGQKGLPRQGSDGK